jgi:hypothetical protein
MAAREGAPIRDANPQENLFVTRGGKNWHAIRHIELNITGRRCFDLVALFAWPYNASGNQCVVNSDMQPTGFSRDPYSGGKTDNYLLDNCSTLAVIYDPIERNDSASFRIKRETVTAHDIKIWPFKLSKSTFCDIGGSLSSFSAISSGIGCCFGVDQALANEPQLNPEQGKLTAPTITRQSVKNPAASANDGQTRQTRARARDKVD